MSLILETDGSSDLDLYTDDLNMGEYTAVGTQRVGAYLRLSGLNGAAATYTIVMQHLTSGGALIGETDVFSRTKRTPADTVFTTRIIGEVILKDGEKVRLVGRSTNPADTDAVAYTIDWLDGESADAIKISGDATAADNLKLACDNYSATRGLAGTALPAAAADGVGGLPISDAGGLDLDAKLAETNEITAARMGALTDLIDGGRLDLLIDAILEDTSLTLDGYLTDIMGGGFIANTHSLTNIEGYVDLIDDGTSGLAKIAADAAAILLDTGTNGVVVSTLTTAGKAEVQQEATDALNAYDPPTRAELTTDTNSILSKLLKYVQLLFRKDAAIATDNATELTAINANGGSGAGAVDNTTDALEAIRDNGDVAWVSDGGLTQQEVADSFKLAPTAGAPAAGSVNADLDAILLDTAEIGAAGAGLTNINLPDQAMNITGNITGNLSGSVGSITGNVGGNVVGSVGSLSTQAKADVNAEADTAIADYDPPTNAEMEARTLVAASYGTAANQTTILARLGAWTGTGLNTILGAFRALAAKAVSLTPTDISTGTTFDNTVDSLEAVSTDLIRKDTPHRYTNQTSLETEDVIIEDVPA